MEICHFANRPQVRRSRWWNRRESLSAMSVMSNSLRDIGKISSHSSSFKHEKQSISIPNEGYSLAVPNLFDVEAPNN